MALDDNFWGDISLKREALKYIWELSDRVRPYLTYAVEYVNTKNGESKEEFWRKLFIPSRGRGNNARHAIKEEHSAERPERCPENPYRHLDMQAVCKFLLYGKERDFPAGVMDDSRYYFDYFIDENRTGEYENTLSSAIRLRNKETAHITDETVTQYKRREFEKAYNVLYDLTICLARKEEWRPKSLQKVREFWEKNTKEKNRRFGIPPIALETLGQELFAVDDLTDEQKQWLENTAEAMSLHIDNRVVYGQAEYGKLLEEFREFQKMGIPATGQDAEEVRKAVAEKRRQRVEAIERMEEREAEMKEPVWKPVPERFGKLLRSAGCHCAWNHSLWDTLLDSFVFLMDETVFLTVEGREMLRSMIPVLLKRRQKLSIDASVITEIFKQFRGSKPYTGLELAEMDPGEIGQMQQARAALHQRYKTAIKMLRHMRECACLEVVASPTDSRDSYENIRYLVRLYPEVRFLVFTMDRQLVRELATVKGGNAVAAKPGLDRNLLFFRATRNCYRKMLESVPKPAEKPTVEDTCRGETVAPVGSHVAEQQDADRQQARTVLQKSEGKDRCLPARREPQYGDTVKVEFADGQQAVMHIGKFVSDGGEGRIYGTDRDGLVAKIYFPAQRRESRLRKLKNMIAAEPAIEGLCWPCALLYNQWDEWIGFLMPRAEGVELAKTVFAAGRGSVNITKMGWSRKHLVAIAGNIAGVFSQMHQKNILMGDINPRNFMVQKNCTVYFVDCDSYQFGEFSCPVFSPLFLPPEVHRAIRNGRQEASGFLRTEQNELYSLAVLLFEILMLGKAPYESRNTNNDDVVQAIIDGNFPYPYKAGNEDEDAPRSNIMAPVGSWRYIWSNMPYLIKTDFFETFSGGMRHRATEWQQHLDNYLNLIEEGKSSDELMPRTFKVVIGQDGQELTKMRDLTCTSCGRVFNQAEEVFAKRQARHEEVLCEDCRNRLLNFRKRKQILVCDICHKRYEGTVADWIEHDQNEKPLFCPDCMYTNVRCSKCGKTYKENRIKWGRLMERGKEPLCSDCFRKEYATVTCSGCGRPYVEWMSRMQSLQRLGRPLLCAQCRRRN